MIKQRWSLGVVRQDMNGSEGVLVGEVWLRDLGGFDKIHPSGEEGG
jgi:hypothetical protein